MFTGIVEDIGTLGRVEAADGGISVFIQTRLTTEAGLAGPAGIGVGDSIAVSGCCLTATEVSDDGFAAQASSETLARTTLDRAAVGDRVNLERSLAANGRLGGHIVQGHVDGVGHVVEVRPDGDNRVVRFGAEAQLLVYMAEKGSVAVDGVSLTINGIDETSFWVTLVPFTLAHTTLGEKQEGDPVNLETDVLAKYVVRYLQAVKP